jgi:hypothetical protein
LRCHGEWFKPDYELRMFLKNHMRITITSLIDEYKDSRKLNRGMKRYIKTLESKRLYL